MDIRELDRLSQLVLPGSCKAEQVENDEDLSRLMVGTFEIGFLSRIEANYMAAAYNMVPSLLQENKKLKEGLISVSAKVDVLKNEALELLTVAENLYKDKAAYGAWVPREEVKVEERRRVASQMDELSKAVDRLLKEADV